MHYAKYGRAAAGSILLHAGRGIDSPNTHEHSNENIDKSRTRLNYDLKDRSGQPIYAYYKKRIDDIAVETKERTGRSIRKDAVTLCSWVVTVPRDLPEEKLSEFFMGVYGWFADRYGEDNIVTAAVHMDEITPHIHLQFTPIIEQDGVRRLCAKDVETRKTLQTAHQKLQNHLELTLGCEVNILNGATEQGNKSVLQLQNETLKQQIAEKKKQAQQAEERVYKAKLAVEALQADVDNLTDKKNDLTGDLIALKRQIDDRYNKLTSLSEVLSSTSPYTAKKFPIRKKITGQHYIEGDEQQLRGLLKHATASYHYKTVEKTVKADLPKAIKAEEMMRAAEKQITRIKDISADLNRYIADQVIATKAQNDDILRDFCKNTQNDDFLAAFERYRKELIDHAVATAEDAIAQRSILERIEQLDHTHRQEFTKIDKNRAKNNMQK